VPEWCGAWFELYSQWFTIGAQLLAATLVAGSYFLAEELKSRGPKRRGEAAAVRATAPPEAPREAAGTAH
ncbi:MAG: hypothetical protein REI11_07655, partial [Patulibacter sp.]|nr:hypothetical protein [Patulibacter sp.]